MDIGKVLIELHNSEINAPVETFYDSSITVRLGDQMNGFVAEHVAGGFAEAATWLHDTAIAHYPNSAYTKVALA